MSRITIGIRVDAVEPEHVRCTVFMGPASGRGNCGTLTMRRHEFWYLVDGLRLARRSRDEDEVVLTGMEVPR